MVPFRPRLACPWLRMPLHVTELLLQAGKGAWSFRLRGKRYRTTLIWSVSGATSPEPGVQDQPGSGHVDRPKATAWKTKHETPPGSVFTGAGARGSGGRPSCHGQTGNAAEYRETALLGPPSLHRERPFGAPAPARRAALEAPAFISTVTSESGQAPGPAAGAAAGAAEFPAPGPRGGRGGGGVAGKSRGDQAASFYVFIIIIIIIIINNINIITEVFHVQS